MTRGQSTIHILTKVCSQSLPVIFALLPSVPIFYLYLFQRPPLQFENHSFHEIAIAASTLAGAFVSYIAWRCYSSSAEPFLRWLTLGFLGFTLVYAPHGILTSYSHQNLWLFLLYGATARVVMGGCLLTALLVYGRPADSEVRQQRKLYWWQCAAIFLLVDLAVAAVATSPVVGKAVLSMMEIGALCLSLSGIVILIARRIRSPLMTIFYSFSLACFAQSAVGFMLGHVWNHLWWLAHGIFATGFFLLSYAVIQAFLTTRSFATVYSPDQLMERALATNAEAQWALCNLQGAHLALAQKAEELSHSNLLLDRTKQELEHRIAELDDFSSNIAQHLRSPILAVDGFAQVLMEDFGVEAPPTARKHLSYIRQFARAMDLMVRDLQYLAQSQREQVRLQPTPLSAVVESVLREIKAEFPDRAIVWRIKALPVGICDPGLIRQVFANLLSNAVKFTRDQKPAVIEVTHEMTESEFIICVNDNGIGFDPEMSNKLFEPFVRLPSARGFEGNGLGLATVQRIVHKHSGRVWAESLPNQGASFYFALQKVQLERGQAESVIRARELKIS